MDEAFKTTDLPADEFIVFDLLFRRVKPRKSDFRRQHENEKIETYDLTGYKAQQSTENMC